MLAKENVLNNANLYAKDQIDKVGNAIVYVAERISPLSKAKILKLLYLIEEHHVQKYGVPFFNIDFELWCFGPVLQDVYVDLCSKPALLDAYFSSPKDEFSDVDISLMDEVIKNYGNNPARDPFDITRS